MATPRKKKKKTRRAEPPAPAELEVTGEVEASDPLDEFFVSADEAEANRQIQTGEVFSGVALRSEAMLELLAFWVADEEYGVDIVQIQEIIKVPEVTKVPRGPECVLGIISLRGTVVPVANLRTILGMDPMPVVRASRILVLQGEGEPVGLLVDRVSSVVRFDREAIQPVPRTMQREASDLLMGVGRERERMLIILDLPAVLAATEYAR